MLEAGVARVNDSVDVMPVDSTVYPVRMSSVGVTSTKERVLSSVGRSSIPEAVSLALLVRLLAVVVTAGEYMLSADALCAAHAQLVYGPSPCTKRVS